MNYTEITNLALSYADRSDPETVNAIPGFYKVVETRINRVLKVQKMAVSANIPTASSQYNYGLPADFAGLRNVQMLALDSTGQPDISNRSNQTLQYTTPEKMNDILSSGSRRFVYTIEANQLMLSDPQDDVLIEITYYRKLPALTTAAPNNWLSDSNPDAYLWGLLVEISAFTKDGEAKAIWNQRFKETLNEIGVNDDNERWSGVPLKIGIV